MKKIVFLLIVALVISGAVWAQIGPGFDDPFAGIPLPPIPSIGGSFAGVFFDMFSAVPTSSTEARYSAWRFSSDVDDYIDVNYYDPKIGTFFFLGGFPQGNTVDKTDVLTEDNGSPFDYAVSFGFGKTLKAFYLGVYYGGSIVNAIGGKDGSSPNLKFSEYLWRNNLALLVGTHGYGAFRLDMILDTETASLKSDSDPLAKTREYAPSFALTWGGIQLAGMDPYVTIGFAFPEKYTWGLVSPTKKLTYQEGGGFALQAGINYDLSDTSSLSADMVVGGFFGEKLKGDKEAESTFDWVTETGSATGKVNLKTGGVFAIAAKVGYSQKLDFGKLAIGFKPKVTLGFLRNNNNVSGDVSQKNPSDNMFNLYGSMDMGFKFQANPKVALYTGASLQVLNYLRLSHSGGDPKNKSKEWAFNGLAWDDSAWNGGATNTLGFGMTITPVKNLVIGCGLNTFLDKLFTINLREMKIESGDFFDQAKNDSGNIGGWAGYLFQDLTFDLTVSYKY